MSNGRTGLAAHVDPLAEAEPVAARHGRPISRHAGTRRHRRRASGGPR
jgi:hypothetical protein